MPKPKWLALAPVTGINASAAAFPAQACLSAIIQADPANTTNMLIGDATRQVLVLTPGASIELELEELSDIYRKMESATVGAANIMVAR